MVFHKMKQCVILLYFLCICSIAHAANTIEQDLNVAIEILQTQNTTLSRDNIANKDLKQALILTQISTNTLNHSITKEDYIGLINVIGLHDIMSIAQFSTHLLDFIVQNNILFNDKTQR